MVIDIDHFKQINDEYGHPLGDELLEKFGKSIRTSARSEDSSCRLGGDELLMAFQSMPLPEAQKSRFHPPKIACDGD